MKFLFCIAAAFIATMYYIGVQKDIEEIDKFMDNNLKLINILAGRDEDGTFADYPITFIETTIEEIPDNEVLKYDHPSTYQVI